MQIKRGKDMEKERFRCNCFKSFDRILVSIDGIWYCDIFSHVGDGVVYCVGGRGYRKAIPYNEETKKITGTSSECPEYYRWWKE